MSSTIPAGARLGRYEIQRLLGAGGMGEVYLAEDTRLDRKVAIKFLNRDLSKDADKLNCRNEAGLEIEPLDLNMALNLAWAYMFARQYDRALDQAQKTHDLEPNFLILGLTTETTIRARGRTVIQDRFASVGGVRLHYLIAGKGEPVILLRGYAQNSRMWRSMMVELAKTRLVIAPDLRGFGL